MYTSTTILDDDDDNDENNNNNNNKYSFLYNNVLAQQPYDQQGQQRNITKIHK